MALKKQDKQSIDLLLPTAFAGIAAFMAFKKKMQWQAIGITMLAVWLLSYIVISQITKRLYLSGPAPVPTGGGCDSYSPDGLVQRLRAEIYRAFGFRDLEVYREINQLADCQLIKVHNMWNQKHFGEHGETLYAAIADEVPFLEPEFSTLQKNILNRLSTLNLQ